jgi:nitrogen fixation protein NifU and related proteins
MSNTPYSATLLEHFRRPRNYGTLEEPDARDEVLNPLCGDRIRLELRIVSGIIEDVRFRGDACAICIAATSTMTEMLRGLTVRQAESLTPDQIVQKLQAAVPPARTQCALLPLDALRGCLAMFARSAARAPGNRSEPR